jgi:protein-S-isoprenylcysteine O-methyltransferase Ste14
MFLRALFAFLVLPGTVGGLVPWLILSTDRDRGEGSWAGAGVLLIGLLILLWCVRDFYVTGKGTLAPWDPPKRLVVVGLYRFVRNPMYIGVLTLVAGWSLLAGSSLLAGYAGVLAAGFHLRVSLYEEPTLAQQFGSDWIRYNAAVNRWWPRVRPWAG